MKTCCYDDHLPYTMWCSCKDLAWSSRDPRFESWGWNFFSPFFLIRPITITLIIYFFFHFYSGWNLGVAVPGIYINYVGDFLTIFFST